mmetsp:Transcript_21344/g.45430  ORF Transcript_21344/g.45430 Transcript_21344/m.45430 type:complete len:310 (+) Transcript_21344:2-931(+)
MTRGTGTAPLRSGRRSAGPGAALRRRRGGAVARTAASALALLVAALSLVALGRGAGFVGEARGAVASRALTRGRPGSLSRSAWDIFGAAKEMLGQQEQGSESIPGVEGRASLEGGPYAPPGFSTQRQRFEVVRWPHPALRRENVKVEDFDGRLQLLVQNLFTSMYAMGDGIGLAAPQVGVNLRVMVYNDRALDDWGKEEGETVFVNPRILAQSENVDEKVESCLSFPRMSGPVVRPIWVEVEAEDFAGRPFRRKLEGFEARLFLHEYDHLDGKVYIDLLEGAALEQVKPTLQFLEEDYSRLPDAPEAAY